jgi:hypothetical protein
MLTKLSDSWKTCFKITWSYPVQKDLDTKHSQICRFVTDHHPFFFLFFFILHQKQGHHVPKHFLASYGGFHGGTTSSHPFYPFSVWIFTKGFSLEKSFQL